jgi:hypothetical protein
VRLTYARFWSPVIEEKIIAPYWLIRTRRGWELDAAPGDGLSDLRTYLLNNVREMEILDSSFEPPADLAAVITKHRTETAVVLEVPHDTRWAVDKYAERVELITDSPDRAVLRVHLLQPVRLRVGMMLVAGGPITAVPLVLFAFSAQRISFLSLGLMQYIAPSVALLLGIWVFHEPFGSARQVAFGLIWAALLVFTLDALLRYRAASPPSR